MLAARRTVNGMNGEQELLADTSASGLLGTSDRLDPSTECDQTFDEQSRLLLCYECVNLM